MQTFDFTQLLVYLGNQSVYNPIFDDQVRKDDFYQPGAWLVLRLLYSLVSVRLYLSRVPSYVITLLCHNAASTVEAY